MLDVHPPHSPTHTWKDFFLHIATIVVGLLIAVGLEQTVEYLHHRHQIAEAREALRREREINLRSYQVNVAGFHQAVAGMKNNLIVLQYLRAHPGTPEARLPGTLRWGVDLRQVVDSAWKNAQLNGVAAMLPQQEAEDQAECYRWLSLADIQALEVFAATTQATSYSFSDPDPSHFSPAQIDKAIALTQQEAVATIRWGVAIANLHLGCPEFAPAPTLKEISEIGGFVRTPEEKESLVAADAISNARLAAVESALRDAYIALDKAK